MKSIKSTMFCQIDPYGINGRPFVPFKVDSWYIAIVDCTIAVHNQSIYLPKSANL